MWLRARRRWAALSVALLGCGGSPAGPSASKTSAADFQLTCAPSSFSGLGCGSGTCSISSNGVAGEVRLYCADLPTGVNEEALKDVRSALAFHLDTFGKEALEIDPPVLEAFVAETGVEG